MNANQLMIDFDAKPAPVQPARDPGAGKETSLEAHRSTNRTRDRQRILERMQILGAWGATRDELSVDMGIGLSTVCGRINELLEDGFIYETENRRVTRTGRTAVVLVFDESKRDEPSNDRTSANPT